MLNPLNASTVAAAPPPQPPPKNSAAPANPEAAADDFSRALDDATPKPPNDAARERLRSAARLSSAGAAANRATKAEPRPMPALAEGKTGQTQPPQADDEHAAAGGPPTPPGVATLLAELRAAAAAACAGAPGDATGQGCTTPTPTTLSDRPKLGPSGNAFGTGIDPGSASAGLDAGVAAGLAAASAAKGRAQAENGSSENSRDSFGQQLAAAPAPAGTGLHSDNPPDLPTLLAAPAAGTALAAFQVQAEGQLSAAPGSADFGPQLGAQISTFVRDGIDHARLHLNPVEMGPVSVQIQLDGQTARVHLSAENPHTRQALEQALPLLASSLREAGLTLTGGGVFEQPRQRDGAQAQAQAQADAGAGGRHGRSDDGADGRMDGRQDDALHAERSALALRRRGVVDLVA